MPAIEAPAASPDNGLDRELMAIASVVVLGAIMSILDVTVVNVAINSLTEDFDTTLVTIQWVVTGYTLLGRRPLRHQAPLLMSVLSVTLARALSERLPAVPAGGGEGPVSQIPEAVRQQIAPLMADAYGYTFWWAVALLAVAFLAAFLLPFRKPAPEDSAGAGEPRAPVMMHA